MKSETTLNYRMIVEKVPKPNGMVGSSIPDHEIVSLLDEKLAKWPSASCTCVPKK
jgi:hypothetical protein